jgi:hypothetical protein
VIRPFGAALAVRALSRAALAVRALSRAALTALLLLVGPWLASAQEGPEEIREEVNGRQDDINGRWEEPGEFLRVFLMTIGRGDAIWERFGHNALWIQDEETGQGVAYNWGIFDFGQVDFIPRLAKGTMLYRMAPLDPFASLEEYRRADRPVWIQELALTPSQRWKLLEFVRWNALPENREYRYDYYRDNCSTRVRDALDRALGGHLKNAFAADTTLHSYRWHTRRLLRDHWPAYVGIQFVLGPLADHPITAWEEMFLPERLMERIRGVTVPDGEGGSQSLVVHERVLLPSDRLPEPESPPLALPWFFLAGLLGGGVMLWLSRSGNRHQRWQGRIALGLLAGAWAVLASVAGTLLLAAWALTDHEFWYGNWNLLQANPLFVFLLPAFGIFVARGRFPLWGTRIAAVLAGVSLVGAVVQLVPGMGQESLEMLALLLPVNLSLWLVSARLHLLETSDSRAPAPKGMEDAIIAGGGS